jgi:hypothetical protein
MEQTFPFLQDPNVRNIAMAVGIAIGVLIFISILRSLFASKKIDKYSEVVTCPCGWEGQVSVYAGRCPQCNKPLGMRKAQQYKV